MLPVSGTVPYYPPPPVSEPTIDAVPTVTADIVDTPSYPVELSYNPDVAALQGQATADAPVAAAATDGSVYADPETWDLNRDGTITTVETLLRRFPGLAPSEEPDWDVGFLGLQDNPYIHKPGPDLLYLDEGWTPQGQGYDAERHETLTTYYNEDETAVRLSVQDRYTGVEARDVILGGVPRKDDGGEPDVGKSLHANPLELHDYEVDPPNHGGGVSTDGKFIYVADTEGIYVYRRDAVDNGGKGAIVDAERYIPMPDVSNDPRFAETRGDAGDDGRFPVVEDGRIADTECTVTPRSPASYITVKDGVAYVGSYSANGDGQTGAVYRFDVDPETGAFTNPQGPIAAPDQAQGVTVVNDGQGLLFTTGAKTLIYQPITSSSNGFSADTDARYDVANGELANYAQGINIIDGELWVTYESGSDRYKDKSTVPGEGARHIDRIPLDQLRDFPVGDQPD